MFYILIYSNVFNCFQIGFNEEASFTLSRRNQFSLSHNGHLFNKHRSDPDGQVYWYCKRQRDLKCKVKAYTRRIGYHDMVKVHGKHNH